MNPYCSKLFYLIRLFITGYEPTSPSSSKVSQKSYQPSLPLTSSTKKQLSVYDDEKVTISPTRFNDLVCSKQKDRFSN